jgi:cell division septation protein DedD
MLGYSLGEKGGSKADTLVKLVLVCFLSLLSFSVGTFVGKQVSDSDHRRMALEGEYKGERNVASTEEKGETAGEGDKISEKEVENLTEEFVNKEKSREPAEAGAAAPAATAGDDKDEDDSHTEGAEHKEGGYKNYVHGAHGKVAGNAPTGEKESEAPVAHEKAEAPTKAATHAAAAAAGEKKAVHAMKEDGAKKAAEKVVAGKAPTDGKTEERKPQSVLPSVANSAIGKYAVQVASYADEGEAKTHAAELKSKGYSTAFYLAAQVKGKTYYRVLVGLFESVKSADEYRAQLMKDTGTKSAIVQKIVQ